MPFPAPITLSSRYVFAVDESIVIRPMTTGDINAVSSLARRSWADAFGDGIGAQDVAAELEAARSVAYFATALTDERKTMLVAEQQGQVIGYVQFGDADMYDIDIQPGDRELHRVYVDTIHQGRGVGRRLTEAALAHPRLAGANRVFLRVWDANERAISLYTSLGFKRIGTTRFFVGGQEMEDAVYVRDNRRAETT
jgi:ribosomal protein S18 acetylase RimI-like enzyme